MLCVSLAAMSFGSAFAANAAEKVQGQFGWFGVGKTYEIDKGHYYWVGEFTGTFFNDKGEGSMFHKAGVKCPAFYEIDANGKTTGGDIASLRKRMGIRHSVSGKTPARQIAGQELFST